MIHPETRGAAAGCDHHPHDRPNPQNTHLTPRNVDSETTARPSFVPCATGRIAWYVSTRRRTCTYDVVGYLTTDRGTEAAVLMPLSGRVLGVTEVNTRYERFVEITDVDAGRPGATALDNAHTDLIDPQMQAAVAAFHQAGHKCNDAAMIAQVAKWAAERFRIDAAGVQTWFDHAECGCFFADEAAA